MARSGVQYEDVQRAVETLLDQGETPSVQKVREILGTGSFTTINEHLREWRARRDASRDAPPTHAMPEAVASLAERLWTQAQEAAGDALAQYRDAADRRVEAAHEATQDAERQAEDAAQREAALAAHLGETQQRLEARSAALATAEAERDQRRSEAEQLGERVQRLTRQLEKQQTEHERRLASQQEAQAQRETQLRERLSQEEQRHESAEARLMALLDEARQERQAVEKARVARERQLETRLAALQEEVKATRGALAEEEQRHREANWACHRAEELAQARQHEKALLQARIDEQRRLLDEQARRLRELESQFNRWLWQEPAPARPEAGPHDNSEDPDEAGSSAAEKR
ncbi:DNA-binding protein [Halomonas sp. NO4]|uniref:DNA-binding protein n=1 Tax=Halomonas sp. NO4 TaxID=2484813 RepID=UPI0013D12161|nr:DNA-binding protein [Halomonas sp. NO4]